MDRREFLMAVPAAAVAAIEMPKALLASEPCCPRCTHKPPLEPIPDSLADLLCLETRESHPRTSLVMLNEFVQRRVAFRAPFIRRLVLLDSEVPFTDSTTLSRCDGHDVYAVDQVATCRFAFDIDEVMVPSDSPRGKSLQHRARFLDMFDYMARDIAYWAEELSKKHPVFMTLPDLYFKREAFQCETFAWAHYLRRLDQQPGSKA